MGKQEKGGRAVGRKLLMGAMGAVLVLFFAEGMGRAAVPTVAAALLVVLLGTVWFLIRSR